MSRRDFLAIGLAFASAMSLSELLGEPPDKVDPAIDDHAWHGEAISPFYTLEDKHRFEREFIATHGRARFEELKGLFDAQWEYIQSL
jgi:hypothetical protein